MSHARAVLLTLRQKLPQWEPYIKKFSYVETLEFSPIGSNGAFTITARWATPAPGEYRRTYDTGYVLASGRSSLQAMSKQKVCRFVDDLIMEILRARGVK